MLFLKSLLAIASLALINASPISLSERATCSSYTLISTRGTGEAQGPSAGFRSMISQTLAAIPGGKQYNTIYPAGFSQDSSAGTADIIRKIKSNDSECYILLGYSQGAAATVDALKQLSASMSSVRGVLLIGNPEHRAGLACNVDSRGGSTTKNANGLESFKGSVPTDWVSKTLDICAYGDGVCDTSSGYGITAAHLSYGGDSSVQSMGTNFMKKSLQA